MPACTRSNHNIVQVTIFVRCLNFAGRESQILLHLVSLCHRVIPLWKIILNFNMKVNYQKLAQRPRWRYVSKRSECFRPSFRSLYFRFLDPKKIGSAFWLLLLWESAPTASSQQLVLGSILQPASQFFPSFFLLPNTLPSHAQTCKSVIRIITTIWCLMPYLRVHDKNVMRTLVNDWICQIVLTTCNQQYIWTFPTALASLQAAFLVLIHHSQHLN